MPGVAFAFDRVRACEALQTKEKEKTSRPDLRVWVFPGVGEACIYPAPDAVMAGDGFSQMWAVFRRADNEAGHVEGGAPWR